MSTSNSKQQQSTEVKKEKCGVIMPISGNEQYSAQHWLDVKEIIFDVIKSCDLDYGLVSDSDEVNIIQKNIVTNIFQNELIVCDVSSKNPNVMFELGLRLAFDKPTIIITDDKASFIFDTQVIEHIVYPKDLRYNLIEIFKTKLSEKIIATLKTAKEQGESYSTYLQHFVQFKPKKLNTQEVDIATLLEQKFISVNNKLESLNRRISDSYDADNSSSINASPWVYKENNETQVRIRLQHKESIEKFESALHQLGIAYSARKMVNSKIYKINIDRNSVVKLALSFDFRYKMINEFDFELSPLD